MFMFFLNNNNIDEIFKDEWWSRAWTLQEYLANDNCFSSLKQLMLHKHYNVYFYDDDHLICNKHKIWNYSIDLISNIMKKTDTSIDVKNKYCVT